MRKRMRVLIVAAAAACFGLVLASATDVFAATNPNDTTLKSAHYELSESSLGNGGGQLQSSSANYVLGASTGDAAVGNTAGTNYQANTGSQTTGNPSLTFAILGGNTSFGSFSPTTTATATAQFQVSDYTSYGYLVIISGKPPAYDGHQLPAMATPAAPTPGTEQFGINLVANTSPTAFGTNPDHGQFGFGEPTANYNTPNKFQYIDGDTIASAQKSSGVTTYTISYVADVNSLTPGGQYKSDQVLICIATY
ncbi:MAG TPA: hypothetical protein VF261_00705 [Candidatus Saccharimonadales bacterium]